MNHALLLEQAVAAHQAGQLHEAEDLYQKILATNPHDIDALNLLGSLRHGQKRSQEAEQLIRTSLQREPNNPPAWYNLGIIYFDHKKFKEAAAAFMEATKRAPDRAEFWLLLGRAYLEGKEFKAALSVLQHLKTIEPNNAAVLLDYGLAQEGMGDYVGARQTAEHALALALANQVPALRRSAFTNINALDRLLNEPKRQRDWAYMHALVAPDEAEPWAILGRIALAHSENLLADALLARAEAINPARLDVRWLRTFALALPIYANQSTITRMLAEYEERVSALHAFVRNMPQGLLAEAEDLITISHPLFLAYCGEDVTRAQRLTGALYHELFTRLYGAPPLLTAAERKTRRQQDGKIRLAWISETLYYHSNMKLRRSWLKRLDRSRYHITAYHVGEITDTYTAEIREMVDEFHYFPKNFAGVLQHVRTSQPDIIQYTNLGLNPLTLRLASLRLAPVQATTWGHPITSGLPTIDYYLSSELMEPADGPDHYTEKLVLLPGLSVVPQPIFNVTGRDYQNLGRAHFGLKTDDVVYYCGQSLQKYLPKYDDVYARIAQQVPKAKFVFIEHAENVAVAGTFKLRLATHFHARGLDPAQFLHFVPFQEQSGYRALHMLADITLDSLGWSGANTTFEALELGGLVLTYGDRFMRGRHTVGCLKLMDVPDLIASSLDDYVQKAITLGQSPAERQRLRTKLAAALPVLHTDPGLGEALNEFYTKAYDDWAASDQGAAATAPAAAPRAFKQNDLGIYQRDYESYEAYVEHQKGKLAYVDLSAYDANFAADLTERLRATGLIKTGMSALCLAARLGGECRAFINNGAFAVGIDLNPGAQNKYVMVGDFHALQFADHSIDVAYTNCIDHAFDISKMMAEVRRVLKPNGLFIAEIMRGLEDEHNWRPDDYDCAFWNKTDDIVQIIAEKLGGAATVHREAIASRAGWAGDMIVFKLPA